MGVPVPSDCAILILILLMVALKEPGVSWIPFLFYCKAPSVHFCTQAVPLPLSQVTHHAARRQELLRREYMTPNGCPAQPPHGFKGQLHACWAHRLSQADARAIVQGEHTSRTATSFGTVGSDGLKMRFSMLY